MSNLTVVYPPGSEKAIGNQTGGTPEKPGSERGAVRVNGSEGAKGNQDLARSS